MINTIKSFLYDENKKLARFYVFCGVIYYTQATSSSGGIPSTSIFFYLKEGLNISASTVMYLFSIISMAWWLKSGMGLLSDFFPIRGYRRISYIYICNSLSILLWILLAGMAYFGMITTYLPILIILVGIGYCFAMIDVCADGLMVEVGKPAGITGKLQSVQWSSIRLATMLTVICSGALALWVMPDTGKSTFQLNSTVYHRLAVVFLIASVFPLINILATYFLTDEKKIVKTKKRISEVKNGIKKALSMKSIWILALCIFGLNFSPGWGTPFFYYLRDYCGSNHGQMGKMAFAYLSTLESGMGILGCIAYYKYSSRIDMRRLLYASILLAALANVCYLWVQGIKSLIVVDVLFGPLFAFVNLAFLDIVAKNCPDLVEGFVFAAMMSVMNIASSASMAVGGWMYKMLEVGGDWYDWGWSFTGWLSDYGVSQYMVGLRPLILISAVFTLVTMLLIPLMKLDRKGIMQYVYS